MKNTPVLIKYRFKKQTLMRKLVQLFLLTLSYSLAAQQASPGFTRKVLFSTGIGEKPVFNESSISLSPIGNNVTVITSDEEDRIYVYENGKKRGPFKEIAGTGVKKVKDDPAEYDPVYRRESDDDYQNWASYDKDGQVTIIFQGKSYGPFQFILEFYSSNNKTAFFAIVMKEGKPLIITSAGNSIFPDGQPGYSHISPTGRTMMVTTIRENADSVPEMTKDISKKSNLKKPDTGKDNEEKQMSRSPKAFVYFQDGKRFGPYDPKKITQYNPAFVKTGGDNWLLTLDSKLYINGKAVRTLGNERISPANIWLTEDGRRYAILAYNKIEFSDGAVYNDPLKIRIMIERNIITVWWLMFENKKDIVLYSKIL
jgi:hypothetical protein